MKKIAFISILIFIVLPNANGQRLSKLEITKKWQLRAGWFPLENLQFIETQMEHASNIFKFEEDGNITHLGSLEGMDCDVGELTMKDGRWTLENNILTLELRGLKVSDYWYWWKVQYKIEIKENKMFLEVVKVLKNRQISPTRTWKELIAEK